VARAVALTGATGYVGRNLARRLAQSGVRVRALSRDAAAAAAVLPPGCEIVMGDLRDPAAMQRLLEPGCDVVNLAYLWDASPAENLRATRAVLEACAQRGARRLVHLSTVAVFGRAPGDRLDEDSPCLPVIPYGRTKLAIEALLAAECRCPYTVLRPTTVFGEAGPPLDGLIAAVRRRRFAAYLRSVLFGGRRMNLVHVDNVVAAIVFLLEIEPMPHGAILIVSDDDHPANNYRDVERHLMARLGVRDYALPRPSVPPGVLALLLRLRGHNNVNPRRVFDARRLAALGYRRPVDFLDGLSALAAHS
jgi:nucleoside-diphosphate-sugar epimerase